MKKKGLMEWWHTLRTWCKWRRPAAKENTQPRCACQLGMWPRQSHPSVAWPWRECWWKVQNRCTQSAWCDLRYHGKSVFYVREMGITRKTRECTITSPNYFEECVGIGCSSLQLNGQSGKEDNLHGSTWCILEREREVSHWFNYTEQMFSYPERSWNSISVCYTGRLEKCSCPCPTGHNGGSDKTRLDCSSGRVECFWRLFLIVESSFK